MADLAPLLRLGRWQVDEQRRQLGALLTREDALVEERAALDAELVEQQAAAAGDSMGAGLTFAGYLAAHGERCAALDRAVAALRAEIEAAREQLAEAYRQVKTYELVVAAREKRAAEERARKEQIVLDDIGQTLHRRRQDED